MTLFPHSRIWLVALTATTLAVPAAADEQFVAYLAGTCGTCHRAGATDSAIPALTGRDVTELVKTLQAYRSGARQDALMQAVANSLSDAEATEVAAYLASREPPQ